MPESRRKCQAVRATRRPIASRGAGGDDILIGGATLYDGKPAALAAVMQAWTSADSFDDRRNRLATGFKDAKAGLDWLFDFPTYTTSRAIR